MTLYALVLGKLPFQAADPVEMFRQIREDEYVPRPRSLSFCAVADSPSFNSPQIPTTLSPELQHLLTSLLTKDPLTRPSLPSLWSDAWVTSSSNDPLPAYDANVASPIADPSSDEVDHALAAYRGSAFLAMSAAAKFKGLLSAANVRRASSGNSNGTPPTSPPPSNGHGDHEASGNGVMVDSPELVASPFSSSPPDSPSASRAQSHYSGGVTTQQPGAQARMRRREPRQQTTMSSLSLGSRRWASADDGRDDDADERGEEREARERSGSPTPRPPSPKPALPHFESEGGVVYGGAEELSDSMAAAGVSKPARDGDGDGRAGGGDDGQWDEPE